MILSNSEIYRALDEGRLVIDPEPAPRTRVGSGSSPFNTSSVDLSLDESLSIPKEGLSLVLDPTVGDIRTTLETLYERHNLSPGGGYRLKPRQLVLGQTRERVNLPLMRDGAMQLAARVEGRSSLARCGLLVHFTAPTIHAGFNGTIALEMMNLGPTDILLTRGMRICQLIIEEVRGTPDQADSMFQGQSSPTGSPV